VSLCGNGACAGGESCESCPGDCGACPCAGFGCPCDTSGDCDSQLCYEVDGEGLCTEACVEDCPAGWTCASGPRAGGDLLFVCVPDPCEPTDELCDGLDNDCNGQIDDLKGDCEVVNEWGTCKGTPKCQQTATICEGAAAEPEACDGADNDCDGEVDEGFADENGDGVADCLPICGDGTCNGGETCGSCSEDCGACCSDFGCPCEAANDCSSGLCVEGGGGTICTQPCVDSCPAPYVCKPYPSGPDLPYACLPDCDPKADELCDGLDNDCDGDVDEGFADTDKDGAADCVDDDDD
jgi:hypothetical protein